MAENIWDLVKNDLQYKEFWDDTDTGYKKVVRVFHPTVKVGKTVDAPDEITDSFLNDLKDQVVAALQVMYDAEDDEMGGYILQPKRKGR